VVALIGRCLSFQPAERPTAEELVAELEASPASQCELDSMGTLESG
jgi:hypothetical protein